MARPERITGRLVSLRPLTREDLAQRIKWLNDPEVQTMFIGVTTGANDEHDMRTWFHLMQEDPLSEQWAVEWPREGGKYAGDVDLHSIMPAEREGWITPLFGHPSVREKEVRRDILTTMARYAFEHKDLETLWAQIPDTDVDTIAVMEEMGFQEVEKTLLDFFEGVSELTLRLDRHSFRDEGP